LDIMGSPSATQGNTGKPLKPRHTGDPRLPLDAIFRPRSVAVIGATETAGSVGRTILWNLISNPFGGTVFPVNPKRSNVLGIRAYTSVNDLPEVPDLAVVVTPAPSVPGLITQCGEIGVPGAVVISAGFKETGPEGAELERQLLEQARRYRMRVVGPNCLGVMSPVTGLNATFAAAMARPGNVGFLSQSGALCTAVLDWSFRENVGFSHFVSIGSMVDVGWGDLIDYLGHDARTRSIVIYMESIGDARAFISAAREVALSKPIIVIKAGRTSAAAQAAASHTGSLTGSDEVLDAAFHRSGVLRVDSIAELFYMAEVLAKQPRPRGPRLTILTNAGGPGVLATDALITNGGQLTELSDATIGALNALLPAHWSHNNPIDVLGDAAPDRYAKALEIAASDPGSDGLLVVLTPQSMTDPTQTAEQIKPFAKPNDKPVLASWMGGPDVAAGETILNRHGVPTFPYPDTAARMFALMWGYSSNLKALYETPALPGDEDREGNSRTRADAILQKVRSAGRTILTEVESKQVLAAYDIPTVEAYAAATAQDAVTAADRLGYPVVLKLHSETLTHKSDVGGVQLNLRDGDAVRRAYDTIAANVRERAGAEHFLGVSVQRMATLDGYELILGSSIDPQFGPVLLFGQGGKLVEVYKDRALGLPPLSTTLARRLMEQTKVLEVLKGVRGERPVDLEALEQLLVRFSQMICEQPWIKELDINPLLVSPDRFLALDARIVVHGLELSEAELPRLSIRPYPQQYVDRYVTKTGVEVTIRPIRPEDEPLMVRFHETLSERSVYFRYFHMMKLGQRIAHERLTRICFIDYDRDMALVAETRDDQQPRIVGVGRLTKQRGTNIGEFAVTISDGMQGCGLGTELLRRVVEVGRREGLDAIVADILPDNRDMQRVSEKVGFRCTYDAEENIVRAHIDLRAASA
jgi:acetyltransferase